MEDRIYSGQGSGGGKSSSSAKLFVGLLKEMGVNAAYITEASDKLKGISMEEIFFDDIKEKGKS